MRMRCCQAARLVLACSMLFVAVAASPVCKAGDWHADSDSGVRIRIPWDDAIIKNAAQVENLILHDVDAAIPPGQRYTSAVYAPGGMPFFVVWLRPDAHPPTRADLRRLASRDAAMGLRNLRFDPQSLRGSGDIESLPGKALRARVLFQITKGATVFLGYFYEQPEQALHFEALAASFELAPSKRLTWAKLAPGAWALTDILLLTGGILAVTLLVTFVLAMQRKPRLLPPSAPASRPRTPDPERERPV